jgi:hypothetical protein
LDTADSHHLRPEPDNPFASRRNNKTSRKKTEEEKKRILMNLSEENGPKKTGTFNPPFQPQSSPAPGRPDQSTVEVLVLIVVCFAEQTQIGH